MTDRDLAPLERFEPLGGWGNVGPVVFNGPDPHGDYSAVELPRLEAVSLDRVEMRPIEWLDKPFLQRTAFQLVAGPKGVGKGTWLARVTANMTRGLYGEPRNVLLVSARTAPQSTSGHGSAPPEATTAAST